MPGFGEEEDRVDMLLLGEEDAGFRAEGGEKDGPVAGKAVDEEEDGVDHVIGFRGGG